MGCHNHDVFIARSRALPQSMVMIYLINYSSVRCSPHSNLRWLPAWLIWNQKLFPWLRHLLKSKTFPACGLRPQIPNSGFCWHGLNQNHLRFPQVRTGEDGYGRACTHMEGGVHSHGTWACEWLSTTLNGIVARFLRILTNDWNVFTCFLLCKDYSLLPVACEK